MKISTKRIDEALQLEGIPAHDRQRILRRAKKVGRAPAAESKKDCVIYWNSQWSKLCCKPKRSTLP